MSPVSEITPAGAVKEVLGSGGGSAIMGSVSSAGAILAGTGFSVTRLSAGQYAITFNNPFLTTPVINVTMADPTGWRNVSGGAVVFGVAAGSATPYGFTAIFEYPAGTFQDTPFFFIASAGVSLAPTLMSDKSIGGSISSAGAILSGIGFTINKGAAGIYTINFSTPFPSTPIVVATTAQANGYVCTVSALTASSCVVTVVNPGSSNIDAAFNFVATLGFTYTPTTLLGKMINGIIASNGAISAGSGFTCVRNSAGNYTVTFSTPFPTAPIVVANLLAAASGWATVSAIGPSSFVITTYNYLGAATDYSFNFTAQDPNLAVASSTLPPTPSAMTLICDSGPIASQAIFDTQTILGGPIPQIYKHLKLEFVGRTDGTGGLILRVNNDSTANYRISTSGAASLGALATEWNPYPGQPWCHSGAPAECSGALDLTFFDYVQASYAKRWIGVSNVIYAALPQGSTVPAWGGWNNTSALQRIALSLSSGNFTQARFSLYGI